MRFRENLASSKKTWLEVTRSQASSRQLDSSPVGSRELIEERSVDYFNLRISKCGGLFNTLAIAQLAQSAKIGLQVGCQVGETAILSAAGRHFAAHLKYVRFIEGSYGTHLLTEDISKEDITFGVGGKASILKGVGLGIKVQEHLLERFAKKIIQGT